MIQQNCEAFNTMKITIYDIVWDVENANLPTEVELDEFDCIDPYNFNPDEVKNMLGDRYGVTVSSINWVFAD